MASTIGSIGQSFILFYFFVFFFKMKLIIIIDCNLCSKLKIYSDFYSNYQENIYKFKCFSGEFNSLALETFKYGLSKELFYSI